MFLKVQNLFSSTINTRKVVFISNKRQYSPLKNLSIFKILFEFYYTTDVEAPWGTNKNNC